MRPWFCLSVKWDVWTRRQCSLHSLWNTILLYINVGLLFFILLLIYSFNFHFSKGLFLQPFSKYCQKPHLNHCNQKFLRSRFLIPNLLTPFTKSEFLRKYLSVFNVNTSHVVILLRWKLQFSVRVRTWDSVFLTGLQVILLRWQLHFEYLSVESLSHNGSSHPAEPCL